MEEVKFPGLNLNLQISDIAFQLGSIKIYWYGLLIVLAILISLISLIKDSKRYNVKYEYILEMFLITIPISFITARLYYVIFEWEFYSQNLNQIFNIRSGGLAIYGGIIGAVITILIYSKFRKIKFFDILDMYVPYLALAQAIGRWGNFFNIEAYGTETTNFLRMGIIENGKYIEVHPTFLYESIGTFSIFIILTVLKKHRKYSGQLTVIYLICYSILRMFIEGLRTDSLMWGDFRVSQILSIILLVIGITILIVKYIRTRTKKESN